MSTFDENERFRLMADCSPVLLWLANDQAHCTFFNKPWLEFTGRTMEQEYGYGWAEGVHFEDYSFCIDYFMQHFKKRQPFSMEYRLKRHDGEYRWILDNGRPLIENNIFRGYVGSCIDITALREAQNAKIEQVKLLTTLAEREQASIAMAKLNEDLESFSYSVSHNLQSPLATSFNYLRFIRENNNDANAREKWIQKTEEKMRELEKIIYDLLNLSRSEREPLRLEEINLPFIIDGVAEGLRSSGIAEFDINYTDLAPVFADEGLLKQALNNIIGNAIKYAKPDVRPQIKIRTHTYDGGIEVIIEDNGIGIHSDKLLEVFRPFKRLIPERQKTGHGLGLYIVEKIMLRHGGKIWAESHSSGSSIHFVLPEKKKAEGDHAR